MLHRGLLLLYTIWVPWFSVQTFRQPSKKRVQGDQRQQADSEAGRGAVRQPQDICSYHSKRAENGKEEGQEGRPEAENVQPPLPSTRR